MGLMETVEPQTLGVAPISRDDIAAHLQLSWDELFGMDRAEVERFQLRSAQRRFEELVPKVKLLKTQVDASCRGSGKWYQCSRCRSTPHVWRTGEGGLLVKV